MRNTKQKLYVMKNALGLLKIGISNNPKRRATEIRLNSGLSIDVLKVLPCENAFDVEQWLHKEFSGNRLEGEWFEGICVEDVVRKFYKHDNFRIPVQNPCTLPCMKDDILEVYLERNMDSICDNYYRNLDSFCDTITKITGKPPFIIKDSYMTSFDTCNFPDGVIVNMVHLGTNVTVVSTKNASSFSIPTSYWKWFPNKDYARGYVYNMFREDKGHLEERLDEYRIILEGMEKHNCYPDGLK